MEDTTPVSPDTAISDVAVPEKAAVEKAAEPFVGRWNKLVSTTNWDKGAIIHQWRETLLATGAPATDYSDEAWSQCVGGVTGQHAGRLRRVYARFGDAAEKFKQLFWSHFQAALDWEDAEMWLEGAVQNSWSVAKMRTNRWETLGAPADLKPREEDVISTEIDEDFEPALTQDPAHQQTATAFDESQAGPTHEGSDFGDEPSGGAIEHDAVIENDAPLSNVELVRHFEDLPDLPDDVIEAVDAFKLAIVRHKADDWREIKCDDLLLCLDALKQFAAASADETAPF